MRVDHIMTRDVVTVAPETPLKVVASTLLGLGISGLPVCGRDGTVLGVVSESDVLFKELGREQRGRALFPELGSAGKERARTAGEAMTAPAVVTEPQKPVWQAARKMVEFDVNRLPVVEDGRLVGIVTRTDLVSAFHRPDAELERELRDEVFAETLWIDPAGVDIDVEMGDVQLRGEVDTKTSADLAAEYAARVPGVVSVSSELTWLVDDQARRTRKARVPARV